MRNGVDGGGAVALCAHVGGDGDDGACGDGGLTSGSKSDANGDDACGGRKKEGAW